MYRPSALPRRSRPPRRPSGFGPGSAAARPVGSAPPSTGPAGRWRDRPPPLPRPPRLEPDPLRRDASVPFPLPLPVPFPLPLPLPFPLAFPLPLGWAGALTTGRAGRVSPIFGRSAGSGRTTAGAAAGVSPAFGGAGGAPSVTVAPVSPGVLCPDPPDRPRPPREPRRRRAAGRSPLPFERSSPPEPGPSAARAPPLRLEAETARSATGLFSRRSSACDGLTLPPVPAGGAV
jgi:hypothetical protein